MLAIAAEKPSSTERAPAPDERPALETLLPAIQGGDDAAARTLMECLYPFVLKIVRAYRLRRTGEEDLCQMVFVRMFQRLHQFTGAAPLEHWVSRIAVNTCLNEIEKERIRPELRHADLSESQAQVVEQLASTTAELPEECRGDANFIVQELLQRLDPKDRLLVTLLHLEERSIAEIKELTGWNTAMIKVRAFRARQKLKRFYRQLDPKIS